MDGLTEQANALTSSGRFGEALAQLQRSLQQRPDDGELLHARACVLFDWGRLREAHDGFLRTEAVGVKRPSLDLNLAWTHLLRGSTHDAERYARRALASDPDSAALQFSVGTIFQSSGHFAEAIAAFDAVLALDSARPDCLVNIAACRLEQRAYAEAEQLARRAIAIAPDRAAAWVNLGMTLAQQDQLADALAALQRADQIEAATGDDIESFVHQAYWLLWSGQPGAALTLCRRKLPAQPNPNAHGQYAFALLTAGQYREGWEQYEFRWFQEPMLSKRRPSSVPGWAGQDLAGKHILLRAEQGAGDTFQFARYAMLFKAMGAVVTAQVQQELGPLASRFAGVDNVVTLAEADPPADYCLSMMSAPLAFGTEVTTIPAAVPYLSADPSRVASWTGKLPGKKLHIGIAWAGNSAHVRDRHRSIPVDALGPLFHLPEVQLVSMQKQLAPDDAKRLSAAGILNLGEEFEDFGDTAAVIENLDLMICVDTAIAHLAGAMGKPVWLMLPACGDFRWLRDRDDSPWYPTMRLFRQRRQGDWPEVVERVRAALVHVVDDGSLAAGLPAFNSTKLARDATLPHVESATGVDPSRPEGHAIARVVETRHGIVQFVPDVDDVGRSVAWFGEYLEPQLDLLARLIRPGAVVLEAGSGIGIFALALARIVGADGHLMMYESRPLIRRVLHQNLQANREDRIHTLMRRALATPRHLRNQDQGTAAGLTPTSVTDDGETETIDDLGLDRLDLLKVFQADAVAILEGAAATLWRLRPLLFLAATDESSVMELAAKAGEYGYRSWQMTTPLFNPNNFNCRKTDIFGDKAAYALLAVPEENTADINFPGCVEIGSFPEARSVALP